MHDVYIMFTFWLEMYAFPWEMYEFNRILTNAQNESKCAMFTFWLEMYAFPGEM